MTYNDIKQEFGFEIAEIVYALTNDKGRTRKERAGEGYYFEIKITPYATFVKLCDRLANTKYSYDKKSRMLGVYAQEYPFFRKMLYTPAYEDMFKDLEDYYRSCLTTNAGSDTGKLALS